MTQSGAKCEWPWSRDIDSDCPKYHVSVWQWLHDFFYSSTAKEILGVHTSNTLVSTYCSWITVKWEVCLCYTLQMLMMAMLALGLVLVVHSCIPKDLPNGHRMLAHLYWVGWCRKWLLRELKMTQYNFMMSSDASSLFLSGCWSRQRRYSVNASKNTLLRWKQRVPLALG